MGMTSNSFLSLGPHGFHRIAYTEWGEPSSRHLVVCVHGLTRNSRDFDFLAAALERDCRVVCMDVVGRGRSEWLEHKQDYGFGLYQSDAAALLARITAPHNGAGPIQRLARVLLGSEDVKVDWVGTSMGGLIGMMLAAQPRSPIRRLVLNDVGPLVPWTALSRLKGYMDKPVRFATLAEVEGYIREVCAPFGSLSDEQWRHLALHSARHTDDGGYVLAHDPGIGSSMRTTVDPAIPFGSDFLMGVDLWSVWDAIKCHVLVLRGAESDVLRPETARQMQDRGPGAQVVEFPGVGHAPALMSTGQIQTVRDFLLRDPL
ncbi:MAG: alpha/beta hydrolase [Betaproteobacteria bacterium]|nr:alpha/beta hydrolase [Betaproteobacteria bacterium]